MFAKGIFPQRTLHQVRSDGEKKISGSDGWIAFLAPDQLHSPIFLLNLLKRKEPNNVTVKALYFNNLP